MIELDVLKARIETRMVEVRAQGLSIHECCSKALFDELLDMKLLVNELETALATRTSPETTPVAV